MTDTAPATSTIATSTPSAITTSTTIKPGIKTSEGILSYLAVLLSGLFGSGLIPTAGAVALVATIAAIALTAAGYSVSRAIVKAA